MKKIFEGAQVDKRYSIMSPEEVFSLQSFEQRNAIYAREMIVLGEIVLQKALQNNHKARIFEYTVLERAVNSNLRRRPVRKFEFTELRY